MLILLFVLIFLGFAGALGAILTYLFLAGLAVACLPFAWGKLHRAMRERFG